MTQEQKELLLNDLCARLPYKPIVQIDDCGIWNLRGIDHDDSAELRDRVIVWHGENYPSSKNSFPIINCKPYLFPLSSMTGEQTEEVHNLIYQGISESVDETKEWLKTRKENDLRPITLTYILSYKLVIDWFRKNHFDYYGLIPMGLALDATGKNIY